MNAVSTYESPLGEILLAADEEGLTGLWFRGQKYFPAGLGENTETGRLPVFEETERWLDLYFQGRQPDFLPALHMQGTPFQKLIWELLLQIPYGETTTYGALAKKALLCWAEPPCLPRRQAELWDIIRYRF